MMQQVIKECHGGTDSQMEAMTPEETIDPERDEPVSSARKPLAKESDMEYEEKPTELPPALQREIDAQERWESQTSKVVPSPYKEEGEEESEATASGEKGKSGHDILVDSIAKFNKLSKFGTPRIKQDLDSFIQMLAVKASLQVKTIANAMAATDEGCKLMLSAIEAHGLRSMQNASKSTRASLVVLRKEEKYQQNLWTWDASTQKIIPRIGRLTAEAAVRMVETSFVTVLQGYMALHGLHLNNLGTRIGGTIGTLLEEIEDQLTSHDNSSKKRKAADSGEGTAEMEMSEGGDDDEEEPTGPGGAKSPPNVDFSLSPVTSLPAAIIQRMEKAIAVKSFFVVGTDLPSGMMSNMEALMMLEARGLMLLLEFKRPYALLTDGLFESSSLKEMRTGDESWYVGIKPPLAGLKVTKKQNALTMLDFSPNFNIPIDGTMIDGNRDEKKKPAALCKMVSLLVHGLKRSDVLVDSLHESNNLLELTKQLYKFSTAKNLQMVDKSLRDGEVEEGVEGKKPKKSKGEPAKPTVKSPELAMATAFCTAPAKLDAIHKFIWNLSIDYKAMKLRERLDEMQLDAASTSQNGAPSSSTSTTGGTAGTSAEDELTKFEETFIKVEVGTFSLPEKLPDDDD